MIHARGYHCEDALARWIGLAGGGQETIYIHTYIYPQRTNHSDLAIEFGLHRQQPDPLPHGEGNY